MLVNRWGEMRVWLSLICRVCVGLVDKFLFSMLWMLAHFAFQKCSQDWADGPINQSELDFSSLINYASFRIRWQKKTSGQLSETFFFQNSLKVREFQFVIINTNIALKNGSINQKVNFCGLCGCHADFKLSTNSMTFNAVKIIKQHYIGWRIFLKR